MPKPRKAEAQPSLFEAEPSQPNERPFSLPGVFLGTSSFTASGWQGSFYPIGIRQRDFLRHYSSQFPTVEIDSTFYGTPAASTVASWNEKTPKDFIFAVKVPQLCCDRSYVAHTFSDYGSARNVAIRALHKIEGRFGVGCAVMYRPPALQRESGPRQKITGRSLLETIGRIVLASVITNGGSFHSIWLQPSPTPDQPNP